MRIVILVAASALFGATLQGAPPRTVSASPASVSDRSALGTSDPIIGAAGDIACASSTPRPSHCRQVYTAGLLASAGLTAVLALGDEQYPHGVLANFMASYDPTWGAQKVITYPVPGNHEYQDTASPQGYFAYFGTSFPGASGHPELGYYSFDLGAWHLIALNANCDFVACKSGSDQETWLKNDLATHANLCTLAFWHQPMWSSPKGAHPPYLPFTQDLYNAGADVLLVAHVHHYERFAPQDPQSNLDTANGIREFVVGTGGKSLVDFTGVAPNSEKQFMVFGVLELTLHPDSYEWQFVAEDGTVLDSSTAPDPCH